MKNPLHLSTIEVNLVRVLDLVLYHNEREFSNGTEIRNAEAYSTMPFMYDTLQVEEWLQWVFVPRLHALLDANAPLPTL